MNKKTKSILIITAIVITFAVLQSFKNKSTNIVRESNIPEVTNETLNDHVDIEESTLPKTSEEEGAIDIIRLKEIELNDIQNDTSVERIFYDLSGNKIQLDDLQFVDDDRCYVDDEELIVSQIILEPIKITADYKGPYDMNFQKLENHMILKGQDIDDTLTVRLNKIMGYNEYLNVYTEFDKFNISLKTNKTVSMYFYPFVYEIEYKDDCYRILKPEKAIAEQEFENGTITVPKLFNDGIYELRFKE